MSISRDLIRHFLIIYFIISIICPSGSFSYAADKPSSNEYRDGHEEIDPLFLGQERSKEEGVELYQIALALFKERKYDEASLRLKEFLSIYPDSGLAPLVKILIGDSYLNEGDLNPSRVSNALEIYKDVRGDHPAGDIGAIALLRIGEAYARLRFFYEAIGSFKRVCSEFPGTRFIPMARIGMARAYLLTEKYQDALNELQVIIIEGYPNMSKAAAEAYFMKGRILNRLKRFEGSAQAFQEGSARWPDYPRSNPTILYEVGENYMALGKYRMARDTFLALVNIYPKDDSAGKAMARIADSYRLEGKSQEALKIYREALDSFPEGKSAGELTKTLEEEDLFATGSSAVKEKRYMGAIIIFNNLLLRYPNGVRRDEAEKAIAESIKGYIKDQYKGEGCLATSIIYKELKTRIELRIKDIELFSLLGDCYMSLGLYNVAAEIYKEAISSSGPLEDLLYRLGEARFLEGEYKDAGRYLEEFTSSYPKSKRLGSAYRYLGISLYKRGEYKRARDVLGRWLEVYPDDRYLMEVFEYIARSYLAEGLPKEASSIYKRMLGLLSNPRHDLFFRLGDALFMSGNCNGSISAYKEGLARAEKGVEADYARYQMALCYAKIDNEKLSDEIFSDLAKGSGSELIKKLAYEKTRPLN